MAKNVRHEWLVDSGYGTALAVKATQGGQIYATSLDLKPRPSTSIEFMYTYVNVCVYIYMHTFLYTYIHVQSIYKYIHIHIHIHAYVQANYCLDEMTKGCARALGGPDMKLPAFRVVIQAHRGLFRAPLEDLGLT